MKIIQLLKKVNNTEIGKGGTHEYYIYVQQELNVADIFPEVDKQMEFKYKKTGKIYTIRLTIGNEKRIVGLGDFYRENDVCAGDEIILEKKIMNNEVSLFIDLNVRKDVLMIQRCKEGFELLNPDRIEKFSSIQKIYNSGIKKFKLEFLRSVKKRNDSRIETDIFDLIVDDVRINDKFYDKELVEIMEDCRNKVVFVNKVAVWKKIKLETGD